MLRGTFLPILSVSLQIMVPNWRRTFQGPPLNSLGLIPQSKMYQLVLPKLDLRRPTQFSSSCFLYLTSSDSIVILQCLVVLSNIFTAFITILSPSQSLRVYLGSNLLNPLSFLSMQSQSYPIKAGTGFIHNSIWTSIGVYLLKKLCKNAYRTSI